MNSKNKSWLSLVAAAISSTSMYSNFLHTEPPTNPATAPRNLFIKQEGVIKTISQYNKILNDTSSLGVRKKIRIVDKVNDWLKAGKISPYDLP